MKIRTKIKAGGIRMENRCEMFAAPRSTKQTPAVRVRTGIKAGGIWQNRCETLASVK